MNRSSRSARRYLRSSRDSVRARASARGASGSALAAAAGRPDRPVVEPLEPRQLLFALTITAADVNPATGIGTVNAFFGYLIPYLFPSVEVEIEDPDTVDVDFDDIIAVNGGTDTILDGEIFPDSSLRAFHNIIPVTRFAVRADNANTTEAAIEARDLVAGERFSFRVIAGPDFINTYAGLRNITMDFLSSASSSVGLPIFDDDGNPNFVVTLRFQGQDITTYSGASLAARRIAVGGTSPGNGTFLFEPDPSQTGGGFPLFDEIEFRATLGVAPDFRIDNVIYTLPPGNFVELIESRIFGAEVVFSGPVGATATILDLYGRDMRQTVALGAPQGLDFTLVDLDDNGVPEYNDGIGRIVITGTNKLSSLTIWGGNLQAATAAPDNAQFFDGQFAYIRATTLLGIFDDLEGGGFGYTFDQDGATVGLPPGPGSLIIGGPYVRNNASQVTYNPTGVPLEVVNDLFNDGNFGIDNGFSRVDQGIFVDGGASIGRIYLHAVLHGSSVLSGSADEFIIGYLVGSITVQGDAGYIGVGSEAGQWVIDPGTQFPPNTVILEVNNTAGQIVVGRTAGEIAVAGRSVIDVTVIGDINNPDARPPRDVFRYFEREYTFHIDENAQIDQPVLISAIVDRPFNPLFDISRKDVVAGAAFTKVGQAIIFGDSYLRNDSLLSAEFVGGIASAVQIYGEVGYGDPLANTDEDPADVYAFAARGGQTVAIEVQGLLFVSGLSGIIPYIRVVDHDGRTLASPQSNFDSLAQFVRIDFTPGTSGVYYLVVAWQTDGDFDGTGVEYIATLSGIAPTSLGAYRTGAGSGDNDFTGNALGNTLTVLSGNVGSIRVGTGYIRHNGTEGEPTATINTSQDDLDDLMDFQGGVFSVPGDLFNITTGSDIIGDFNTPVTFVVGGSFGTLVTGLSPLVGLSPFEGDVGSFNLQVGKGIGVLDIRGGLGLGLDVEDPVNAPDFSPPDSVNIVTGTSGKPGHIGLIRVGNHVGSGTTNITTSPGSTIGAFLVSQDVQFDPAANTRIGFFGGVDPIDIVMGANSDLRFADFPQIDLLNNPDQFIPIVGPTPIALVDDGGATFTVTVQGAPAGVTVGLLRLLPIDSSQGVALARIDALDLSGGRTLLITGTGSPNTSSIVSIGSIVIANADANSRIQLTGSVQIDVWRIIQTGGAAMNEIRNNTPLGDLVMVDVLGLNSLTILTGDLGRTQVPDAGPRLVGAFYGLSGDTNAVGQPMGLGTAVPALPIPATGSALADPFFNGGTYRPIRNVDPNTSFADDVGAPIDPFLNGLIVRTGNVNFVRVGGAVGDVIVQAGNITEVTANFDGATPAGRFDGIVGSIYANVITLVNIGDGLAQRAPSALSTTGIFANDDILTVTGTRAGAFISSTILAGNVSFTTPGSPTQGIDNISLTSGGDYIDAFIGVAQPDDFWSSYFSNEFEIFAGNIRLLTGTNADFFRSTVSAIDVTTFRMTGGFFDASTFTVAGNATTIEAAGFRNTTLTGGDLEVAFSRILVAENLSNIRALSNGDIKDTIIDVAGSLTGEIGARDLVRADVDVDNVLNRITVENIRASDITVGQLTFVTVSDAVRSSAFNVSGLLQDFKAGRFINTRVSVTGPDGEIRLLTATTTLTGTIESSGPIGTIEVAGGDMVATIRTFTDEGNVTLLKASRDLDITTDIAGTVTQLVAGRHIGNIASPGVILVRGSLQGVDVSSGQLYSDIRVGEAVTGAVTIGPVVNKPGNSLVGSGSIIAFRRIDSVLVTGDYAGEIISYSGGIGTVRITDGSLLPGAVVQAFAGSLDLLEIVRGHLMGDVHADFNITSIRVLADETGVFGDIGINPDLTSGRFFDDLRNQLPPNVAPTGAFDGPSITAGRVITSVFVENGSVFEAVFFAGWAITSVDINGDVRNDLATGGHGSVFAAGDFINVLDVQGDMRNAIVIAGLLSLGADGRPGGTGADADIHKVGGINSVVIGGDASDTVFTAGMFEGADGIYNTADDRVLPGVSFINTIAVAGAVSNVSAFTDAHLLSVHPAIVKGGLRAALVDVQIDPIEIITEGGQVISTIAGLPQLTPGTDFAFTWKGVSGTLLFTGPGQAYWDSADGRVVLVSTSLQSQLTVSAPAPLVDFNIVTNDDGSMGLVRVNPVLQGSSNIVIDAFVGSIITSTFSGTGSIRIGGDAALVQTGAFTGGLISANHIVNLTINGTFGSRATTGEAEVHILSAERVTVNGGMHGLINVARNIGVFQAGSLTINGALDRGLIRSGGAVGAFTAGSMSESRLSARTSIGATTINGTVFDSAILAGGDLGSDVAFGGAGLAADSVTNATMGPVTIAGDFIESDIVAGALRGPDGFFGTSDDLFAPGRSTIAGVTIAGAAFGSNRGSESYLISATGSTGNVTAGGASLPSSGNLLVQTEPTLPLVIQVLDLAVTQESLVHTATLFFNQPMNASTLGPALIVSEVRAGNVTIQLVENVDYLLTYDDATSSLAVRFLQDVTNRGLPQVSGVAGPGVYRFELDPDILRASLDSARLDGNGDGFATPGDLYSADDIVGDPGDKFTPQIITITDAQGNPINVVDYYGPADLDLVLDRNDESNGLPTVNVPFTLRGSIGDHPDNDTNTFGFSGDIDIFKLTLQAGQILRLGAMQGAALFASRVLLDTSLAPQFGVTTSTVALPVERATDVDLTFADAWLIKNTGAYYLVIGNGDVVGAGTTNGLVHNLTPVPGGVGGYAFSIEVFDDGDTGFNAPTDAGNGASIIDAPAFSLFAGPDGVFGTADDVSVVNIGDFTFTLNVGADAVAGTADDSISGLSADGTISSDRTSSGDLVATVRAAIGHPGAAGVPNAISPDIDVFHLNNGSPIAPGTRLSITIRLDEFGSDLGSRTSITSEDFSGFVQLGFFDTTLSTNIGDALLLFSPSDFRPTAQDPGVIADDGSTRYGYDDNGDFFIEFVTRPRLSASGSLSASYAVYVQGVFNTDYEVVVINRGTTPLPELFHQNIFIETKGGTIDWLEAGNRTTVLAPFSTSSVGFTGEVGLVPIDTFILDNAVAAIRTLFQAAGVDVRISTNPADFEFEDFSTIFLASQNDVLNFFNQGIFGYSERSDPLNADRRDEGVVFIPTLANLGYTPSTQDLDLFTQSLTAAITRRIGELLGLRITANSLPDAAQVQDVASASSVAAVPGPGGTYRFSDFARDLSTNFDSIDDTDFFLGRQHSVSLLDKVLAD